MLQFQEVILWGSGLIWRRNSCYVELQFFAGIQFGFATINF